MAHGRAMAALVLALASSDVEKVCLLLPRAIGSERLCERWCPMKQTWIPYAGLAATIALCGYMVVQLSK